MIRRGGQYICVMIIALVCIPSLIACSRSSTPSPSPSPIQTLTQIIDRWSAQSVPAEDLQKTAEGYLEKEADSPSAISYAYAGQIYMVGGDMQAAIDAYNAAKEIDPTADLPHYLLSDAYYRLALFDMFDRKLCSIKLTPTQEIPDASLQHSYLQIELFELVNPTRPSVYQEILTANGVDEQAHRRMYFYLLWFVQDILMEGPVDIEAELNKLGGPPDELPVPECIPDNQTKQVLREALDEMHLAEQATPIETPGLIIVDRDRMAIIAVRIQVLLGEELVSAPQPISAAADTTTIAYTVDPMDVINRVCAQRVPETQPPSGDASPFDYEALQQEQQVACGTGSLMECYTVGYKFYRLALFGNCSAYVDAINTYNLIIEKSPGFGRSHYGLGRVYYDLALADLISRGQYKIEDTGLVNEFLDEEGADLMMRALEEFEIALALNPELANDSDIQNFIDMIRPKLISYWLERGIEVEQNGDPTAALQFYEKILRIDPLSFVAHFDMGNALFALGKFQESYQAFDQAHVLRPNAADAIINREVVRLKIAGYPWPLGQEGINFLINDIKSTDRTTQIGAILLLMGECEKGNQTACDAVENATQQDSTLIDDINKLEITNR